MKAVLPNLAPKGAAGAEMNIWQSRRLEIEHLYFQQGYSQAGLATLYGVSQPAMCKILRQLGIKAKHQGRAGTERQETAIWARFPSLAMGVFARPGWWNPPAPWRPGGTKRTVRGMA